MHYGASIFQLLHEETFEEVILSALFRKQVLAFGGASEEPT